MKEFDNIKDMIYCELDEISHLNKLDISTVKVLGELVDILKDVGTVEMFEEGVYVPEDEYSFANGYSRNGYSQRMYSRDNYDNGSSYRGRSSYNNGYSNRRGGRGGYSRDDSKQHIVEKLHHLMDEAHDENDKESIRMFIEQMENS